MCKSDTFIMAKQFQPDEENWLSFWSQNDIYIDISLRPIANNTTIVIILKLSVDKKLHTY